MRQWHRNIKPASKYPIIFEGRNTHVAQVLTQGLSEEEIERNCNLIAAAPELLEMLKQCRLVMLDNFCFLPKIDEIIDKAEGK